jgi:hypothetical protein
MSLDFRLKRTQPTVVFDRNITHNLSTMAREAGIYEALWHPNENGYTKAEQIIPILKEGLAKLKSDPTFFKTFDSPNGWGMYIHFVPFVEAVLAACEEYPDADIEVSV